MLEGNTVDVILIQTDTIVQYALKDTFLLAFWDAQSQQFEGKTIFCGSSWLMQIGPPAATVF